MLDDPKEISAVITAITSLCIAIIVWIRTVSVQRKIHKHEKITQELKNNLEKSRDILKKELAKELAQEESLLRIRAELRIKMFELGAKAVDEAGVNLQNLIYVYKNYVYAEAADQVAPRTRLAEVSEAVIGTGMFMPPELTDIFEEARSYLLGGMKQRLHEARTDEEKSYDQRITQEAFAEADQKAIAFREAALEWKCAEWKVLTESD